MTFEQALDHVHSFIGNDLIELRSNFRPCIENWENVLGAVDNFDDDDDQPDEHNEDQQVDDELDMAAIEEDEPIPVEEDMSMYGHNQLDETCTESFNLTGLAWIRIFSRRVLSL